MSNIKDKKGKVVEAVIEENDINTENDDKPYFFPRALAYFIDIILINIACFGILLLIPKNANYKYYSEQYEQIQTDLLSKKITSQEFLDKSVDIVYNIDSNNIISLIIQVVVIILYFVVFQFYNNGQTVGKMLMKLRVVSVKGDKLTLNQVTYRALIINSILVNILIIGSLLFLSKNYYYYASKGIQMLASGVIFTTLMMILFRKDGRGLHDVIAGTKVIQER